MKRIKHNLTLLLAVAVLLALAGFSLAFSTSSHPPGSSEPEAYDNSEVQGHLTAMIKRAEGYNPEGGDWEYLVLTGNGATVVSRGRNESCQACHSLYKATDFVTRVYLSVEESRRLQ